MNSASNLVSVLEIGGILLPSEWAAGKAQGGRISEPIRSDLHSIKSDRAHQAFQSTNGDAQKGKKAHADCDNFLLGCDYQKNEKN